jgi:hypothetical protein
MAGAFRVLTTPAFEREFNKISKGNPVLISAFGELLEILRQDPHNRSNQHPIKKLAGIKPGEGQWGHSMAGVQNALRHIRSRCSAALFPPSPRGLLAPFVPMT